jgi:hypothetical protein
MPVLAAQIAPQRSTQYAELASALAPAELALSPLGSLIRAIQPAVIGGQPFLRLEVTALPDDRQRRELAALAMTSACFELRDRLAGEDGPWLRPIDPEGAPFLPVELIMARRYRGKTNELLTRFLLNIARASSAYAQESWRALRVFDPLSGGGTTLFSALVLGADAAGVEHSAQDMQTTAAYLREFCREERIPCAHKEERLRKVGRRWWFSLGKDAPARCLLACGDTRQSAELLAGLKKPHLIVGDLPYGIQHRGELDSLLREALPAWAALLPPGGALALAWDATRFPRQEMLALAGEACPLTVLNQPPYDALAHRVDRVIKRRDVLVAVSPSLELP